MIDKKFVTTKRDVFFDIAGAYLQSDSIVLDIGTGEGSFAKHFNRDDFYLFDGNQLSVELLKQEYKNFFYGKLPVLPFEDNKFDLIHCSHVVEHLEPQVFYESLKEMDRCLRNNGYLVISTPLMWDKFYDDLSHLKPYNPNIISKYLTAQTGMNYTRDKISESYQLVELKFRYHEVFFAEKFSIDGNKFAAKILKKFISLSYRLGLRQYEKNGYTIVLKKENNGE
ncbi:MAG TPA: class I SAM-dependent methyltransferase [Bacteroidales bacterium]|nr:class I SAM-dependent methyltransferase [Bacteroidales bacterium]